MLVFLKRDERFYIASFIINLNKTQTDTNQIYMSVCIWILRENNGNVYIIHTEKA